MRRIIRATAIALAFAAGAADAGEVCLHWIWEPGPPGTCQAIDSVRVYRSTAGPDSGMTRFGATTKFWMFDSTWAERTWYYYRLEAYGCGGRPSIKSYPSAGMMVTLGPAMAPEARDTAIVTLPGGPEEYYEILVAYPEGPAEVTGTIDLEGRWWIRWASKFDQKWDPAQPTINLSDFAAIADKLAADPEARAQFNRLYGRIGREEYRCR